MRRVGLAIALASSVAWADASVPAPPRSPNRVADAPATHCAARLETARTEVAALAPVFAHAVIEESSAPGSTDGRVERVELRLDETLVPGAAAFVFVAQISARRSLWGDDQSTARDWRPIYGNTPGTSIYRQTHRFEGQIAAQGIGPLVSPATVQRIIALYLKPAVEDCLRHFDD